jgi:hypothetical protein
MSNKQSLLSLTIMLFILFTGCQKAESKIEIPDTAFKKFNVIAFYNGTWDAAHINFVKILSRAGITAITLSFGLI